LGGLRVLLRLLWLRVLLRLLWLRLLLLSLLGALRLLGGLRVLLRLLWLRLLLLSLLGALRLLGRLRVLLRLLRLRLLLRRLLGALRLLGRLRVLLRLLRLRLLLLSLLGTLLRLLRGLCVLLRLRLLLLGRLGRLRPLLLLRGLLLLFGRFCLAFLLALLPRVQRASRPDNQKQGRGAGRSNQLHKFGLHSGRYRVGTQTASPLTYRSGLLFLDFHRNVFRSRFDGRFDANRSRCDGRFHANRNHCRRSLRRLVSGPVIGRSLRGGGDILRASVFQSFHRAVTPLRTVAVNRYQNAAVPDSAGVPFGDVFSQSQARQQSGNPAQCPAGARASHGSEDRTGSHQRS
jgi:hypothetical protein